jgi:hypothetical protein
MKSISIVVLISTIFVPFIAAAQDTTTNAKLDTVISLQRQTLELQQKTYGEVYSEPLANKSFGIEFNPAYLLLASTSDYLILSGGFSLFSVDRSAEIAFPVFYQSGTRKSDSHPLTFVNLDATYRRFLGRHQNGFYISGGVRYAYIKGEEGSWIADLFLPETQNPIITTQKFGAYFGIGYRYFSESGIYWGTSIIVGRYFTDDTRDIRGVSPLETGKGILDFELLKFGIAF